MPISQIVTNSIANGAVGATQTATTNQFYGFKNRIINGAMTIDQRNAGASVTVTNTSQATYTVDRWFAYGSLSSKFSVQQNAGSVTPPAGYTNYLGATSLAATSVGSGEQFILGQYIEGFNCADLGWGTTNAQPVTLSFWVRSSLTGTFGGSFMNEGFNRSYPFTYTISAANTWEQKTITVAGDTTGTWLRNNSTGIRIHFGLGVGSTLSGTAGSWAGSTFVSATGATSVVGTNGATFYITGVQLEKGSTATSFDYRPYGTELSLCQRYFEIMRSLEGSQPNSFVSRMQYFFKASKRATPTITLGTASNGTVNSISVDAFQMNATGSSGPYTGDGNGTIGAEL